MYGMMESNHIALNTLRILRPAKIHFVMFEVCNFRTVATTSALIVSFLLYYTQNYFSSQQWKRRIKKIYRTLSNYVFL